MALNVLQAYDLCLAGRMPRYCGCS
jgi:hypothetical protein